MSTGTGRRRHIFGSRIAPAQLVTLGVLVYGVWLLLSGIFEPFLLAMGLVSTAFAIYIAIRMDAVDEEGVPLAHLNSRVWSYLPWLVLEVIHSNLAVVRIVLSREMPISPAMVRFRPLAKTELGRFIFANSITLTPGTITTEIIGDEFEVHALFLGALDGIEEGEMNRRVAAMEKGHSSS
jgi:multicomponent Na+:H+ antiporter subunit E